MKKLVVLFSVLVAVSTFTFAQQSGPKQLDPETRAKVRADRMKENLGLSEEQYKQVLALNTRHAKERQDLIMAHREAFKKQNDNFKSDLGKVLTKEQIEKFEGNQNFRKDQMKGRMKNFHGQRPQMNQKASGKHGRGCEGCCQKSGGRKGRGRN